jgi:hypothetical protein
LAALALTLGACDGAVIEGEAPDASSQSSDASAVSPGDASLPSSSDAGAAPTCLPAAKVCTRGECCEGFICGTNALGQVCCGTDLAVCSGASDCCGDLECVDGACTAAPASCVPAAKACSGAVCCTGLSCGSNALGKVCCASAGAACSTADGSDCCGDLDCVGGKCTAPAACKAAMQACSGSGCCAGLSCGTTTLGQVCCGNAGHACSTADGADCCGELECVGGQCTAPATCKAAMQACSGGGCCAGLSCGTTTLGQVCCGNAGHACSTADGADCCGDLECVGGKCTAPTTCKAAMQACSGSGCCAGLTCGQTTLGQVCCGNAGHACSTADGADCCGDLECVGGKCTAPTTCKSATQACSGSGCCAGLTCGTTTLGQVCCGNAGHSCSTADGADCCGDLECVGAKCTAPTSCKSALQACSGGGCCSGLSCGSTTAGQVCCGNQGHSCKTADGSDCCGDLLCVNGQCGYGSSSGDVISSCGEGAILAAAPANAVLFIKRALDWVHRGAMYSQSPQSAFGGYRTDCSGLVSMSWGLPPPGHTTYSFAGGPWDDGKSYKLSSWGAIRVGDALNYPGSPSAGTGHIQLFGGWLNGAHTSYCCIEEYDYGHPAEIRSHSLDTWSYIPIRLTGFTPSN